MITRPLDLASRMRPEPRNFDWLFFVNGGLVVLFFSLFGSQFVLAPGMSMEFALPVVPGSEANAKPASHAITVLASGLILTNDGYRDLKELEVWLTEKAKSVANPVLLVKGDRRVNMAVVGGITSGAMKAGFREVIWAATEKPDTAGGPGR